jgi:hypothetical protein
MRSPFHQLLLLILLAFLCFPAQAKTKLPKPMNHALNFGLLTVFGPGGGVNYEFLMDGFHGLLVESSVGSEHYAYMGGYRYHFSGAMESLFGGIYARYQYVEGSVTEFEKEFYYEISGASYGVNLGKRWVWENGVNVALRIGGGPSLVKTKWKGGRQPLSGDILINSLTSTDLEISFGFVF